VAALKLFALALDGITAFTWAPLRLLPPWALIAAGALGAVRGLC
jgi:hypothetical protein